MKKLMFALACAASVAAFADGTAIGFEGMIAGTTDLGNKTDSGTDQGAMYFAYEPASGSTDGSIVKAYGQPDNLPAFDYTKLIPAAFMEDQANTQYLELSTEGGTLWRGFNTTDDGNPERELGGAVEVDPEDASANIYVDTLVQFTPTEDGTAPTVSPLDQMAIWLNVDSTDPDAPVTNLCVLAAVVDDKGGATKTTFTALNKAQGGIDIDPGTWYRLTVKMYGDLIDGEGVPGFMIYIDGAPLKTDTCTLTEEYIDLVEDDLNVPAEDLARGSVFASLWTLSSSEGDPGEPTFTAVGFKGSGAIDDLVLTTDEPNFGEAAGSIDFTLTWDAGVSAVTYTLNSGEAVAPAGFVAGTAGSAQIEIEAGWVVAVQATPAAWLTASVSGAGEISEAGKTVAVTTALAATPAAAGAVGLDGIATVDAKAWADAKGITPDDISGCNYAKNAYLMNTDLSAAPGLKITAIEETEGGWNITVQGVQGEDTVTLDGIKGTLKVKTAATLAGLASAESAVYNVTLNNDGTATIKVTGNNTNFMKATVE